jgi:hypothetical protein
MEAVKNSSSWAEMVRQIDAERKTLPWKPGEFVPTKTITLAEVSMRLTRFVKTKDAFDNLSCI